MNTIEVQSIARLKRSGFASILLFACNNPCASSSGLQRPLSAIESLEVGFLALVSMAVFSTCRGTRRCRGTGLEPYTLLENQ